MMFYKNQLMLMQHFKHKHKGILTVTTWIRPKPKTAG